MPRQLEIIDLGVLRYDDAYAEQGRRVEEVVAARDAGGRVGYLLLVSHPPVITVSRRAGAGAHLLATPELLASKGIEVRETDRGGDITYHGPGQLVVYPILDLNLLNLGLHEYMRMLEQAVIDTCEEFGIRGERDSTATGVWVAGAKICAFGVRVRKWVSMHGLALNVETDLSHFGLIVPCGLHGRPVTSVKAVLGAAAPGPGAVLERLVAHLSGHIDAARRRAEVQRDAARSRAGG
ncbi:MAG: lipoyl(octanoyl) transferase LipB [Planctomycetes bacterium]|nr:lipoyl(octanoyl) transferase LipB [Planctomycetota bacterium]